MFALFFSLYALMGRGTFFTSDEGGSFNTATAILKNHSLAIAPGENIHRGREGQFYACREFFPTLCCLPTAKLGDALSHRIGRPPPAAPKGGHDDGTSWPIFLSVTILGPAAAALTLVLLGTFVREDGGSRATAYWLMALAAFATPLMFYAKTIFSQVFEGAMLTALLLLARRWRLRGKPSHAWGLGLVCGLGMMTRASFALVSLAFALYLLLAGGFDWPTRLRSLLRFLPFLLLGAAVTGWINWLRWGSPFDFGYRHDYEKFSTPPLVGLWGLLASPGKGLFVVAPVMLLPLVFGRALWRGGRAETAVLLGITLAYLALYCRWYDWPGGIAWGPRFIVPLIPPWLALLGRALKAQGRLSLGLGILGFVIQWVAIAVHPKWMGWNAAEVFSWTHSEIVVQARVLFGSGPDDLWLWSRASAMPGLGLCLGAIVIGCGVFLWFRAQSARERWVLLGPCALNLAILFGWFAVRGGH